MEGVSVTVYRRITRYWRRKGYEKLNGPAGGRGRKSRVVELAASDGSSRRRRFWRIKLTTRLKLKLRFTPKKPIKEYDERMIVEIYKSIILAQGQLLPRDAARWAPALYAD
ncbi:Hypothetical predicted protein, partial [Olea europaea subsp. europaea]